MPGVDVILFAPWVASRRRRPRPNTKTPAGTYTNVYNGLVGYSRGDGGGGGGLRFLFGAARYLACFFMILISSGYTQATQRLRG